MKALKYTLHLPKGYHKRKLTDTSKWVKALRSGRYKQGDTYLCEKTCGPRKYCCLGVRLQIQGKLKIDTVSGRGFDKVDQHEDKHGISESNPDFKILDDAGDFPKDVYVMIDDGHITKYSNLAELNDSGKFTFKDIADIIEKVYKD